MDMLAEVVRKERGNGVALPSSFTMKERRELLSRESDSDEVELFNGGIIIAGRWRPLVKHD